MELDDVLVAIRQQADQLLCEARSARSMTDLDRIKAGKTEIQQRLSMCRERFEAARRTAV
ncbi:MAG: hypothetical protein LBF74_07390 [Treponema sp.]|nr:hypothetical protein [Treponema sp.]